MIYFYILYTVAFTFFCYKARFREDVRFVVQYWPEIQRCETVLICYFLPSRHDRDVHIHY